MLRLKIIKPGSCEYKLVYKLKYDQHKMSVCVCVSVFSADFERKYCQLAMIGSGGFGSVYEGFRKSDGLPVSLTNTCSHT